MIDRRYGLYLRGLVLADVQANRSLMSLAMIELIRTRSPGASVGATRANDIPSRGNGCGLPAGNHPSSRTDPDEAEHDTGIRIRRSEGGHRRTTALPFP